MKIDKKLKIIGSTALLGFATVFGAQAQQQRIVEVNNSTLLFAGPSERFNVVSRIPGGNSVVLNGCLSDYAWCEITYRNDRGWIDADSIRYYRNNMSYSVYDSRNYLAYPIISFQLGNYWGRHYRGQPWYGDMNRYNDYNWKNGNHRWDHRPQPPVVRPAPPSRYDQQQYNNRNRDDWRAPRPGDSRWDDKRYNNSNRHDTSRPNLDKIKPVQDN